MKVHLLVVTLTILLGAPALADAPAALPVFGFLEDSAGQPVHGPTDLTFRLYGASDASTHIYSETRSVSVDQGYFSAVLSQGDGGALDLSLFSVSDSIYLGVSVGSEPEMTPRVHLTTSPYAAFAQYAGEAASVEGLTAADLSTVGHSHAWGDVTSKPASFPPEVHTHAFSSLTTIPAGLDDGDDDTVPAMTCGGGNVLTWTGSAFDCVLDANTTYSPATSGGLSMSGTEFSIATGGVTNAHIASNAAIVPSKISGTAWTANSDGAGSGLNADLLDDRSSADFQTAHRRTVVVSPVGTDAENGTALLAAMAGITGASASNPYLLKIEPGVYDLGATKLSARAGVHLQGSGVGVTTIKGSYGSASWADGMIFLGQAVRVSALSVAATGTAPYVSAIYANAPVTLTDLSVTSTGGTTRSVGVVLNINASNPTRLSRITSVVDGGPGECFAFSQLATDLYADHLRGTAGNCGGNMVGYSSQSGALQEISNSAFEGNTAMYFSISNVKHEFSNVRLTGSTYAMDSYGGSPSNGVKLANTMIAGAINASIARTCVSCYNASYAALNATCQ